MKKILAFFIATSCFFNSNAQDFDYVRFVVDTLSSPGMHGRGYAGNGDKIAAGFIINEFKDSGLKCFGENYFQEFAIPINTFPDTINVFVDNIPLKPGEDFVLFSSSPKVSGTFELFWLLMDSTGTLLPVEDYGMIDITERVIVTDMNQADFKDDGNFKSKGIVFLKEDKVWWHVSNGTIVKDYFSLQIVSDKIPRTAKHLTINVENSFFESYVTQNVISYVPGEQYPDRFFVFTAHYDHLGQMGAETYFPGANDNASGMAMLLDLARHFSLPENQPECSIAFMAFSAEEVGLMGSGFYASNPMFPLEKIKFLVNLDMVGSGSEGIKVVNGEVFTDEFGKLVKINDDNQYIATVSPRGEAANSDHYPFYKKGVPCFFIYTLGKESKEYHTVYDTPENAPFTEYVDFFKLLIDFESSF
ncbi:MAG: M28 family peptidase [Bacteroidales bacterium]